MLFKFLEQSQSGIAFSLGRILQAIVLTGLIISIFKNNKQIIYKKSEFYSIKSYFIFLVYIFLISFLNVIFGGYSYQGIDINMNSYLLLINLPEIRPLFEFFITFYQFIYFVVLAPFFIKKKEDFNFLFLSIGVITLSFFVIGWIDFFLDLIFKIEWVPRHLSDMVHVGPRFHSFGGEPRDAFIIVFSVLSYSLLYSLFKYKDDKINIFVIFLCVISVIATQSISCILSIILWIIMLPFFMGTKFIQQKKVGIILLILVSVFFISISLFFFERMNLYYFEIINFFKSYDDNDDYILMSYLSKTFLNNTYPFIKIFKELSEGNCIPFLFGSGIGSSAFANLETGVWTKLQNPNTQITRLFYEFGFIGTILFFISVKKILLNMINQIDARLSINKNKIMIVFALLLSGTLIQRSNLFLINLGLLFSLCIYIKENKKIKY